MKITYLTKKSDVSSKSVTLVAPEKFFTKSKVINSLVTERVHETLSVSGDFKAGKKGTLVKTFLTDSEFESASYVVLPQNVSRGNSPTRKFFIDLHLKGAITSDDATVIFVVEEKKHIDAMMAAIAKLDRLVTYKTSDRKPVKKDSSSLSVLFVNGEGKVIKPSDKSLEIAGSVSWAISLVDRAPTELNPQAFAKEVKARFSKNKAIKVTEIAGKELVKEKLGGIWSVGKAAVDPPRLLCLHHKPKGAKKKIGIAGKGVTYDSGGLNLKISGSMSGMKTDMGGAAAVIGAFDHLVKTKCKHEVIAVLGLVENAIGPVAYKPDDIITMHSGLTVEVNNTDAEGRLVLGDCVSWLARKYEPSVIIDAATLTGAQLVATGMNHAAVVCNDDSLEEKAVKAGKVTGDLVWPLVFAPEILRDEFASDIADMKNSVKNRMNAQSSCAANFIYSHIEDISKLKWLHIDLAGPASNGANLGTGFGVNLISELCQ